MKGDSCPLWTSLNRLRKTKVLSLGSVCTCSSSERLGRGQHDSFLYLWSLICLLYLQGLLKFLAAGPWCNSVLLHQMILIFHRMGPKHLFTENKGEPDDWELCPASYPHICCPNICLMISHWDKLPPTLKSFSLQHQVYVKETTGPQDVTRQTVSLLLLVGSRNCKDTSD